MFNTNRFSDSFVLWITVGINFFLLLGCHPERSESLRLMNEGISYFNAGNIQKAIVRLKQAGRVDPTNDRAFFYQGDILNQMGDRLQDPKYYKQAIAPLNKVLKILPKDPHIFYELGVAYAGSEQIDQAIKAFDQAFEKSDESHGQSQYRKGQLLEHLERYNEAQEAYYHAIKARPSIQEAYFQLNRLYFRFGQWEHARRVIEDGLRHHTESAGLKQDLGLVFEKQKKWVDAMNAYTQAIELDADQYNFYFLRARVAYELQDFQKARQDLKKYLSTSHSAEERNQVRKARDLLNLLKKK